MPKGIVKTPEQEKKWEKAKETAAEQGKSKRWPLIMHIFKQMGGMSKADDEHKNILIERALESQGKKTAIPQEAHEALHSWWQQNRDRLLSPKQKEDIAQIKSVKEKRSKLKLAKGREYLDEMSIALSALKKELSEELLKAEEKTRSRRWAQSPDHTPEELYRIAKLVEEGYHPREAAHLISPTTGGRGEPTDFMRALESYVKPTQLSPKMHEHAKKVAQQWLDQYEQHLAEQAKPEINPILHATSKIKQAQQEHRTAYKDALDKFLASDQVKNLDSSARRKAILDFEDEYEKQNPERGIEPHKFSAQNVAIEQAKEARKKHIEDVKHHIVHGGAPLGHPTSEEAGEEASQEAGEEDVETSAPMSARAISEHMGIGGGEEDEGPKISAQMDPSMKFATQHKKFVESVLRPEVGEKAVKQPAPTEQQKAPVAETPAPAEQKPKTIIRRMAKPDQLERMQRVDAAKMAQAKKE
jgi:hypothetical protein